MLIDFENILWTVVLPYPEGAQFILKYHRHTSQIWGSSAKYGQAKEREVTPTCHHWYQKDSSTPW